MSSAGVEVVRKGIELYNRRDVDEFLVLAHPDCEWFPAIESRVEAKSYRGHDGIRRYFEEIGPVFETLEIIGDEYHDLGGDEYVFVGEVHGRGRGSGVDLHEPFTLFTTLQDGFVLMIRAYIGHEAAQEAIESRARPGT